MCECGLGVKARVGARWELSLVRGEEREDGLIFWGV